MSEFAVCCVCLVYIGISLFLDLRPPHSLFLPHTHKQWASFILILFCSSASPGRCELQMPQATTESWKFLFFSPSSFLSHRHPDASTRRRWQQINVKKKERKRGWKRQGNRKEEETNDRVSESHFCLPPLYRVLYQPQMIQLTLVQRTLTSIDKVISDIPSSMFNLLSLVLIHLTHLRWKSSYLCLCSRHHSLKCSNIEFLSLSLSLSFSFSLFLFLHKLAMTWAANTKVVVFNTSDSVDLSKQPATEPRVSINLLPLVLVTVCACMCMHVCVSVCVCCCCFFPKWVTGMCVK